MEHLRGYEYGARLAAGAVALGEMQFQVTVTEGGETHTFPHDSPVASLQAESYWARVVAPDAPVEIFDPARDIANLSVSRSGESRNRNPTAVEGSQPGTKAYPLSYPSETMPDDFTASLYIGGRVSERAGNVSGAKSIRIKLKALAAPSVIRLTLVEKDGSAWSQKVFASTEWKDVVVPMSSLRSARRSE